MVFCHVHPNKRYYCHLVWQVYTYTDKRTGVAKECYVIGNNLEGTRKRCNGWCYREDIYGILTKTSRGIYRPNRREKHQHDNYT